MWIVFFGWRLTCVSLIDDSKSTSQEVSDKARSSADDAQGSGKTYLQTAQDTASDAANKVSETISGRLALFSNPFLYSPTDRLLIWQGWLTRSPVQANNCTSMIPSTAGFVTFF